MSDERAVIWWVSGDAELVEVDMPAEDAARIGRGETAVGTDWKMHRFSAEDAIAILQARIDQRRARQDDLVTEYPHFKSLPNGG